MNGDGAGAALARHQCSRPLEQNSHVPHDGRTVSVTRLPSQAGFTPSPETSDATDGFMAQHDRRQLRDVARHRLEIAVTQASDVDVYGDPTGGARFAHL